MSGGEGNATGKPLNYPTDTTFRTNPFATRNTRPGAIEFLFPPGSNVTQLLDRLRALDWWGQITGGHGCGKSTLLATLLPALKAAGRDVVRFDLRDGQRRLPVGWHDLSDLRASSQLMIDGYEQLSRYSRWRVRRLCRKRRCGLLVTSHADVRLPLLFAVAADLTTFRYIVERLLAPADDTITADDIQQVYSSRAGNLREALFDLYYLYERRRPAL